MGRREQRSMLTGWGAGAAAIGTTALMGLLTPLVGGAAPAPATGAAPAPAPARCTAAAEFVRVVGQGDLCSRNGTTVVRLRNGRRLSLAQPDHAAVLAPAQSTSNGAVVAAPSAAVAPAALLPAQCVDPASHQHIELFYAHFAGQTDNFAAAATGIQQQFRDVDANYLNYDATYYFGVGAHLYVQCDGGLNPSVHDVALSTPIAGTDFSTIAADMQAQGYSNPLAHYWVWTDGNPLASLGYAGQSSLESSDSAAASNIINSTYEYSVNYGFTGASGARIFAHENGHAMGAVQQSAPHSTGGFHCTDGQDVMCYNDGGPKGSSYSAASCALAPNGTAIFDCNFDDYFNPAPAAGSYLATHWNLASPNNHWLLLQTAASTTSIAVSTTTVTAGQALSLAAAVAGPSASVAAAGGSMSFYDGANLLGVTAVDASGTARLVSSALAPGVHTVTAAFGGWGGYGASNSAGVSVVVLAGGRAAAGIHPAVLDGSSTAAAAIAVDDSHIYARPAFGGAFGPVTVRSTTLFYGTRGTVFANLDGPGQPASAVAINDTSIFVMKNVGGSFGPVQSWSSLPFYGSRATLLADVDGSGRASAVAINDTSIWVMLNNGSGFDPPRLWSTATFYGSRSTVMAVMDHSGRASPVAINDSSIWVLPNRGVGAGFGAPALWSSTAFYGSRGTFLADMDGSGVASAVAINDSSIWVMHNDGSTMGGPAMWSSELFYGWWVYMADVNGSGRASPVAVGPGGIWVKLNTGGALGPATSWFATSYYGTR